MSIMSARMPAAWMILRCDEYHVDEGAGGVEDIKTR